MASRINGIVQAAVILGMVLTGPVKAQTDSLLVPADTSYFREGAPDWNLVEAALRGDPAAVLYLLRQGADPDARSEGGMTALMFAAEKNDTLSLKILLLNGADPDLTYIEETTPLMVAVLNQHFEAAHLLLSFGANPDLKDAYGVPPLVYAAVLNDYRLADLLIFYGADREARDNGGNTPLMTAAGMGFLETTDVLLQTGSHADATDTLGFTPLMMAAQQGDTALLTLLLEYGADMEAVNKEDYTPLALAVSSGHPEAVRLLTDSGANVHHRVSKRSNLADLALRSGQKEVQNILEARGATATKRPAFSELQLAWGNSYNRAEHMMQVRLRLQDTKYRFFFETGYDVRPVLRKVQIRDNDTLVSQYRQSMSVWTHGLGKEFQLAEDGNQISYGLYAAVYGMVSFPRHRGISPNPGPGYSLVPAAGIYMSGRIAGIRAGAERYVFGTLHERPWKMNITLFIRIPVDRSPNTYKTMPY